MTPDQSLFEAKFCGRCGGSGKFSFNSMDGDRCYGCHGSGIQLTARGKAAKAHLISLQQIAVSDLQVGMFIFDSEVGKFLPILEIGAEPCGWVVVGGERIPLIGIGTRRYTLGLTSTSVVRAVRSDEERRAKEAEALVYESTLTKQGKPSKRASLPLAA